MLTLDRNATSVIGLQMDQFTYNYTTVQGELSNRLDRVVDNGLNDGVGGDILSGMVAGNYQYDKLGQLTSDAQEGISALVWRYGDKKLQRIERSDPSSSQLDFIYNPLGQRVLKIEKSRSGGVIDPQSDWVYTYYAYDANGQVMSMYNVAMGAEGNFANWSEANIYGSSRVGQLKTNKRVYYESSPPTISDVVQNSVGDRRYEVTNHLGNVLAVITDRHIWNTTDGLYEAVAIMTSDYYPFGMVMPGRNFQITGDTKYRYAYNGMEQDPEVSGTGNSYTTEFRQYDPRLGRWKSLDPLKSWYPGYSPYSALNNNPVLFTDKDGRSGIVSIVENSNGSKEIVISATYYFYTADSELSSFDHKALVNKMMKQFNDQNLTMTIGDQTLPVRLELTSNLDYSPIYSSLDNTVSKDENVTSEELEENFVANQKVLDHFGENVKRGFVFESDNFVRLERRGKESSWNSLGGNYGYWNVDQLDESDKTALHEFVHGLGLRHNGTINESGQNVVNMAEDGSTPLMTPSFSIDEKTGVIIDRDKRQITQNEINQISERIFDFIGSSGVIGNSQSIQYHDFLIDKNGNYSMTEPGDVEKDKKEKHSVPRY